MQRIVVSVLALAVLVGSASTATAQMHENKKLGYKVRHPKGWTEVPIKSEERWIVGKFIADKEYYDHSEEWPSAHRPEMTVILFPHAVTKDRGVEKTKEGDTTHLKVKNPYRDYEHYLEKNMSEGGWHVSKKEKQKSKDPSWTLIEVKIDKLTYGGKKRLITGVFHAADADYVVQFELLEASLKKLKGEVNSCLKSFEFIAREGSIADSTSGRVETKDEWELSPKERAKLRKESQEIAFRKAKEALPKGWFAFQYKGVYVISHVDKKDAQKIAAQAVAVLKWLDKNFTFFGDEYVRPPIIRICASTDEANAYRSGSGDSWSRREYREIVTFVDKKDWGFEWETEDVNKQVFHDWMRDKDRLVDWWTLPNWLSSGLDAYIGLAKLKGNKLEFKPDVYELDQMRTAKRKGELHPVTHIVTLTGDEFWNKWHTNDQCATFIRFLLDGPGSKMKKGKNFIPAYIMGLREYLAEIEKKEEAERKKAEEERKAKGEKELTEEEEEEAEAERMKERREDWKKKEAETLKAIFDRVFGEWSDDDWAKFERAFRAYLD